MRVLWFTNTPSNYIHGGNAYNGGGWISSLEREIKKRLNIELGIAFFLDGQAFKVKKEGVCYYPIHNPFGGTYKRSLRHLLKSTKTKQSYYLKEFLRVIEDYKPDIINIFGTEQDFGLVSQYTNVPVIIHIQGLLIPYSVAYFPPGYCLKDYLFTNFNIISILKRLYEYRTFKKGAIREKIILQNNINFMGRTEWDKNMISIFNRKANYFYCSEILRNEFYQSCKRALPQRLTITSTISNPLYKGFDVVLKCANLLSNLFDMEFEWRVYGNINPAMWERKEKILSNDVHVKLMGVASSEELRKSILSSTVYVHPSYIDNSPNSVCEAQILGCTVIGQYVGGMPSLVENGKNGVLVPANDPYGMASAICELFNNPIINRSMGEKAQIIAQKRHDKEIIVDTLIDIYKKCLT